MKFNFLLISNKKILGISAGKQYGKNIFDMLQQYLQNVHDTVKDRAISGRVSENHNENYDKRIFMISLRQ